MRFAVINLHTYLHICIAMASHIFRLKNPRSNSASWLGQGDIAAVELYVKR